MPERKHEPIPFLECMKRCWIAVLVFFGVGVVVGAFLLAPLFSPRGNTCGWPDTMCQQIEGSPTARMVLDEILTIADEGLQKGHISQERRDDIARLVDQAKQGTLTNNAGTHVCQVSGPTACEDLEAIRAAFKTASEKDPPDEILWDKALEALREFPSGQ